MGKTLICVSISNGVVLTIAGKVRATVAMMNARFCYQPENTFTIFYKSRIIVLTSCGLSTLGIKPLIIRLLTLQPALGTIGYYI